MSKGIFILRISTAQDKLVYLKSIYASSRMDSQLLWDLAAAPDEVPTESAQAQTYRWCGDIRAKVLSAIKEAGKRVKIWPTEFALPPLAEMLNMENENSAGPFSVQPPTWLSP